MERGSYLLKFVGQWQNCPEDSRILLHEDYDPKISTLVWRVTKIPEDYSSLWRSTEDFVASIQSRQQSFRIVSWISTHVNRYFDYIDQVNQNKFEISLCFCIGDYSSKIARNIALFLAGEADLARNTRYSARLSKSILQLKKL